MGGFFSVVSSQKMYKLHYKWFKLPVYLHAKEIRFPFLVPSAVYAFSLSVGFFLREYVEHIYFAKIQIVDPDLARFGLRCGKAKYLNKCCSMSVCVVFFFFPQTKLYPLHRIEQVKELAFFNEIF